MPVAGAIAVGFSEMADGCSKQLGVNSGTMYKRRERAVRRYLIIIIPLCATIVGAPVSERQRSIAACIAALELKGYKPVSSSVKSRFRSDHVIVSGKVDTLGDTGAPFLCDTRHNIVITLTVGQ